MFIFLTRLSISQKPLQIGGEHTQILSFLNPNLTRLFEKAQNRKRSFPRQRENKRWTLSVSQNSLHSPNPPQFDSAYHLLSITTIPFCSNTYIGNIFIKLVSGPLISRGWECCCCHPRQYPFLPTAQPPLFPNNRDSIFLPLDTVTSSIYQKLTSLLLVRQCNLYRYLLQ